MRSLFPAPAGMIPKAKIRTAMVEAFPRTRGDDPAARAIYETMKDFSPHPRG